MTGLLFMTDISRMTVSLNDFAKVETPMSAVGFRAFTAERRSGTWSFEQSYGGQQGCFSFRDGIH